MCRQLAIGSRADPAITSIQELVQKEDVVHGQNQRFRFLRADLVQAELAQSCTMSRRVLLCTSFFSLTCMACRVMMVFILQTKCPLTDYSFFQQRSAAPRCDARHEGRKGRRVEKPTALVFQLSQISSLCCQHRKNMFSYVLFLISPSRR